MASPTCYRCPECRSTRVVATLKTEVGSYCYCAVCGHAWHDDQSPDPPKNLVRT
jgi:transcription elongation factor Elf1